MDGESLCLRAGGGLAAAQYLGQRGIVILVSTVNSGSWRKTMLKITVTFVEMPGDHQVEAITVRSKTTDTVITLQHALAFIESITSITVDKVTIEKVNA